MRHAACGGVCGGDPEEPGYGPSLLEAARDFQAAWKSYLEGETKDELPSECKPPVLTIAYLMHLGAV